MSCYPNNHSCNKSGACSLLSNTFIKEIIYKELSKQVYQYRSGIEYKEQIDKEVQAFHKFIEGDKNTVIEREVAGQFKSLEYYLEYLRGIEKVFSQKSGFVSLNGVTIKTIRQLIADIESEAINGVNSINSYLSDQTDLIISKLGVLNVNVTNATNAANTAITNAENLVSDVTNNARSSVEAAIEGVAIDANLLSDALLTTVPIAGSTGAVRTQLLKNRENISIFDFFTAEELANYTPTTNRDFSRPVQEFFDYIAANDVGTAYANGRFSLNKGITFGGAGDSKTKNIVGNLHLEAVFDIPITTLFTIQARELSWQGTLRVSGRGGIYEDRRNVRNGLVLGGAYAATHCHFSSITVDGGFREVGLYIGDLTTGSKFDNIRVTRCGSGQSNAGYSLTSSYSNRIDNTSGGNSQASTFTVDTLPPDNLSTPLLVCLANKEIYLVKSVDRVANTITIYGMATSTLLEGTLRYVYGAGVYIVGGDASVVSIGKINGSNCSAVFWSAALYPPLIKGITAQGNMAAVMVGSSTTSASVGGVIEAMYCEANELDFVRITRAGLNLKILNDYAFNYSKVAFPSALRNTYNDMKYSGNTLAGVQISGNSYQSGNTLTTTYNDPINLTSKEHTTIFKGNDYTATFTVPYNKLHEIFGYGLQRILHYGSNTSGVPTKTTFVAPEGYTVNGLDKVVFTGFTSTAEYTAFADVANKNIVVTCLSSLSEPVTTSFTSYNAKTLAPNTQESVVITLTGVAVGDFVGVSLLTPLLGSNIWAEATEENKVTVYHSNTTSEVISTPKTTVRLKVIK